MSRLFVLAAVLLVACSGSTDSAPSLAPSQLPTRTTPPIRVLMLTATAAFRHGSIPTARQVMSDVAARTGFTVTATEDLRSITSSALASVDVLMFALTSGELAFDNAQKEAIAAFVGNGGGYIGIHSASDTLYDWPEYGRIVGAYFKEHPWTQEGTVTVEDRAHAVAAGLGASFRLMEEFYTFRQNPRQTVHVVLALDAPSVGAQGDYPLAWTQTIGRGRSYYNALGHFDSTWRDAGFQMQLANAVRWVAGKS